MHLLSLQKPWEHHLYGKVWPQFQSKLVCNSGQLCIQHFKTKTWKSKTTKDLGICFLYWRESANDPSKIAELSKARWKNIVILGCFWSSDESSRSFCCIQTCSAFTQHQVLRARSLRAFWYRKHLVLYSKSIHVNNTVENAVASWWLCLPRRITAEGAELYFVELLTLLLFPT